MDIGFFDQFADSDADYPEDEELSQDEQDRKDNPIET